MKIVIRTDASRQIGTGHVMRCLSLANALSKNGAQIHFICRSLAGDLHNYVRQCGYVLHPLRAHTASPTNCGTNVEAWRDVDWQRDSAQTLAILRELNVRTDWLVVDHYALDHKWETSLRHSVGKILAVDDLANRKHDCDLLLDQNLYVDAECRYESLVPEDCRQLIGPQFALLRSEFDRARYGDLERSGQVKRILVFFGGADEANHTQSIVSVLADTHLGGIKVDVVIGAGHPERDFIDARCAQLGFTCHVQTERMAALMVAADLAIGAGGSSTWERCCLGLPCMTKVVADNQRQLVRDAAQAGILLAPKIDWQNGNAVATYLQGLLGDPALLRRVSKAALAAVDGRGAARVCRAMGIFGIDIRRAEIVDREPMLAWRNSDEVRQVSRHSAPLEAPEHRAWFASVLDDPGRLLLIGEAKGRPIGVVRFDISETDAEVSIYLVPGNAGHGLGTNLLLAAERWLLDECPEVSTISAIVLAENMKSHGLFASAGYQATKNGYRKRLH